MNEGAGSRSTGKPARAAPRGLSLGQILPIMTLAGIAGGGAAWLLGQRVLGGYVWAATSSMVMVPLAWGVGRELLHRRVGVDLIALVAIAGSLALGEFLAGAVIALMLAGGEALEAYAGKRARRELVALASRAPRHAHLVRPGGLETVAAEAVARGDRLLVKPGEVVPVDGVLSAGGATLDESSMTGEARPVTRPEGDRVVSGVLNAGPPFEMTAAARSTESAYAAIVRLAEEAQQSRAPFVRLADRYAAIFLPITFAIAGGAWWWSGQPVRALAVLVVATPCPLILAAPVALVGGLSRAAQRGVMIKSGAALEALAEASVMLIDKTGTLTAGHPEVSEIHVFGNHDEDEVLRLAASLDQASAHVFARSITEAARARDLRPEFPADVVEVAGTGISGRVGHHLVKLGRYGWVGTAIPHDEQAARAAARSNAQGLSTVFVAVDGEFAGALVLDDLLRPDAPRTIRALRRAGIKRLVLVTGDHPEVAASVAEAVGADRVLSERSPAEKVEAVRQERSYGVTVMVGDGINDAAALAAADVGVAIGARGATASSEAADAVLVSDRLERLAEAIEISRHARGIAVQSVVAGMALSALAMVAAAGGALVPVAGAILQEVIDVAVILNSLRALRGPAQPRADAEAARLGKRFEGEHRHLDPVLRELHALAVNVDRLPTTAACERLTALRNQLVDELLPHEWEEDAVLYPVVARVIGGSDPTGVMSRAHLEISHLVRRFAGAVDALPGSQPGSDGMAEIRLLLASLDAVLRLHMAQEEEAYLPLLER